MRRISSENLSAHLVDNPAQLEDFLNTASADDPDRAERWINPVNPDRTLLYGVFQGDDLVYITSVIKWSSLPYFTLMNQYSAKEFRNSRSILKFLDVCWTKVFDDMHKEGRFTFFYVNAERAWQKEYYQKTSTLDYRGVNVISRYAMTLEEIVPAGQRSLYPIHDSLFSGRIQSETYWVRRGTLLSQFRSAYL